LFLFSILGTTGNNWEQIAIDCPFYSERSFTFRFRRRVRVNICGHLYRGMPEELLRQFQVAGLLVNNARSRMPECMKA